jgi:4-amino-4-deoxy-L-arabinose transferase-like glycosyltransferase
VGGAADLGGGGLLSVMLLYGMLRRFGRPKRSPGPPALLLATMASYWSNVRGVGEDALLALGVTTALLAFFQAQRNRARAMRRCSSRESPSPP